MNATNSFASWETEMLRSYVATMKAFMLEGAQEDPESQRSCQRLDAACTELERRDVDG